MNWSISTPFIKYPVATSLIMVGVLALTGDPEGELQYDNPDFDKFWKACVDHDMAITIHLGARVARPSMTRFLPNLVMSKVCMAEPRIGPSPFGIVPPHWVAALLVKSPASLMPPVCVPKLTFAPDTAPEPYRAVTFSSSANSPAVAELTVTPFLTVAGEPDAMNTFSSLDLRGDHEITSFAVVYPLLQPPE